MGEEGRERRGGDAWVQALKWTRRCAPGGLQRRALRLLRPLGGGVGVGGGHTQAAQTAQAALALTLTQAGAQALLPPWGRASEP